MTGKILEHTIDDLHNALYMVDGVVLLNEDGRWSNHTPGAIEAFGFSPYFAVKLSYLRDEHIHLSAITPTLSIYRTRKQATNVTQ